MIWQDEVWQGSDWVEYSLIDMLCVYAGNMTWLTGLAEGWEGYDLVLI